MDTMQVFLEALLDYIANTPSNFNANLFREFITIPYAQQALVNNYLNKTMSSDSSNIPIEIDR